MTAKENGNEAICHAVVTGKNGENTGICSIFRG